MPIIAQPQWIAKMYEPKKGRDHLGLGSVSSDQILPRLSPGINVLTIYPRYHSFYPTFRSLKNAFSDIN